MSVEKGCIHGAARVAKEIASIFAMTNLNEEQKQRAATALIGNYGADCAIEALDALKAKTA
jgi:hypothetical protein